MYPENSEQIGLQGNIRRKLKLESKVEVNIFFLGSLYGKSSDLILRKLLNGGKGIILLFYFSLGVNGWFRLTFQKCHKQ